MVAETWLCCRAPVWRATEGSTKQHNQPQVN
jgi:hypothetical protein